MYGAIIGDIAGSRFEFDRGGKTKDFEFLTREDDFTDDTVMTVAVADALLTARETGEDLRTCFIKKMQQWGRAYPNAGYGTRFIRWLWQAEPEPYGSWGNGSAMRVSPVGRMFDTLEETMAAARISAEVSHDHPEGIKGAECTAAMIFLARIGADKEEMRVCMDEYFGYDLSESLEEMRARHEHVESCMDSMPKALKAFFEAESYEDAIRNAVSLGGDTDTLAAITGGIAEAFFGIPEELLAAGKRYLPADMIEVMDRAEAAARSIAAE